jgi:hypothetical protein
VWKVINTTLKRLPSYINRAENMKEEIEMLTSAKSTERMVLVLENYPNLNPGKEGYDSEKGFSGPLVSFLV